MSGYEGARLPCIARTSLEDFFSGRDRNIDDGGGRHGSFVTLRKDGDLRGCIGYIAPMDTLYRQVYALARQAAFHDWRFPPLGEDELAKVRIEVSVLSPMKDIAGLDEFVPSRDGILMTCRGHRAVFLPEVADETGWTKDEMLAALSRKAGLPPDAYLDADASFMTFTSEVFHEV